MLAALRHRGPDDRGTAVFPEQGVYLGHQRLSVIDLSSAGRQPMRSHCGRYVLTFNGEIYNAEAMWRELGRGGHSQQLRGHSDTEMFLEAVSFWGLRQSLKRAVGMFAMALWDEQEKDLHLIRDRTGQKPLYYGDCGGDFLFASELGSFRQHPDFQASLDARAVTLFLSLGYVPGPYSIFQGVSKLAPGQMLTFKEGRASLPETYWSYAEHSYEKKREPARALAELRDLLSESVALRLRSDVPLGVLLSGGVDSSLITAMTCARSSAKVRTFTVGFQEQELDESRAAAGVAAYLGTEHTAVILSDRDLLELAHDLPLHDEPFSDPSLLPTHLICGVARQSVTVALGGDGGDELFCGYERHVRGGRYWRYLSLLPSILRRALAHLSGGLAELMGWEKLEKASHLLAADTLRELYLVLVRCWLPHRAIQGELPQCPEFEALLSQSHGLSTPEAGLAFLDAQTYLPDNILSKVDRASMKVNLELRSPLLDHRLVEYAASLSPELRQNKALLRTLLFEMLPRHLVDRPKQGFCVPLTRWLQGPLRPWVEDMLSRDSLSDTGLLKPNLARDSWELFLRRGKSEEWRIWTLLMLQNWYERLGR